MAGNEGHPFFGNQYARSCYTGGYQYDWKPNSSVTDVFKQSAKSVSDSIKSVSSITALPQSENKILPRVSKSGNDGKGAIFAVVIVSVITAIGTGAYFLCKHINKNRKSKEEAFQSIKLENVGTCKHCGEPLCGSEYVDENTSALHTAYIICTKCNEKNYAWYPHDENAQGFEE